MCYSVGTCYSYGDEYHERRLFTRVRFPFLSKDRCYIQLQCDSRGTTSTPNIFFSLLPRVNTGNSLSGACECFFCTPLIKIGLDNILLAQERGNQTIPPPHGGCANREKKKKARYCLE